MKEAILSIGSNLNDRYKNIVKSINFINNLPKTYVEKVSNFYETSPIDVNEKQNFYLNCCVKVFSEFRPEILLGCLLGIETCMGRIRPYKNASRIIDIDLIFYENLNISEKNLKLPHPFWNKRIFVLIPLLDLCEDGKIYGFNIKRTVEECPKSYIKKYENNYKNTSV